MHECPDCLQICCCDQDDLWCDAFDLAGGCRCTCWRERDDDLDDLDDGIVATPLAPTSDNPVVPAEGAIPEGPHG